MDLGEVGLLLDLGDDDAQDADGEGGEHGTEEVMRHRPRGLHALQLHRDRRRLGLPDPDRQSHRLRSIDQQHDRVHLLIQGDPANLHVYHNASSSVAFIISRWSLCTNSMPSFLPTNPGSVSPTYTTTMSRRGGIFALREYPLGRVRLGRGARGYETLTPGSGGTVRDRVSQTIAFAAALVLALP